MDDALPNTAADANMATSGQRFHVDLSSDEEDSLEASLQTKASADPFSFVADVKERPTQAPRPPAAPAFKSTETGFPAHKKRLGNSRFKQQKQHVVSSGEERNNAERLSGTAQTDATFEAVERRRIDEENKQRIAQMSEVEIEKERNDLMAGLSPSVLEKLLRRANIDDPGDAAPFNTDLEDKEANLRPKASNSRPKVTFSLPTEQDPLPPDTATDPDSAPLRPPPTLQPPSSSLPTPPSMHFPHPPPQPPSLDPSAPTFLTDLHTTYFPTFPSSPSTLTWMSPLPTPNTPADLTSPYHPSHPSLPPSTLRFSFRGALIPPSLARRIPVTQGLHHHGDAPEAAGYTIPELARLARSAVPAQRCIAFQTLGRVLFRLGRGEWGGEGGEMAEGLWGCVEGGRVVEGLLAEMGEGEGGVEGEGGGKGKEGWEGNGEGEGEGRGRRKQHASTRAYATEAVWLWRKGGGRWRKAT